MGTRAVITFKEGCESHAVYQHWDGDPTTVAENINRAKAFAWELPRFEADDFAAAYVAATKGKGGGNIYFSRGAPYHGDLSYSYIVTCPNGELNVELIDPGDGAGTPTSTRQELP